MMDMTSRPPPGAQPDLDPAKMFTPQQRFQRQNPRQRGLLLGPLGLGSLLCGLHAG